MRNANIIFKCLLVACRILGLIIPCTILLSLGTWQTIRLKEKLLIIQRMDSEPAIIPIVRISEHPYEKVRLLGTFESSYLKVFAGKNGYYFVQPLKIAENKYILVNRGTSDADTVMISPEARTREIEGIVYCKLKSITKWVAKNDPKQNLWFWYDIDEMSRYLEVPLEQCIIWGNSTAISSGIRPNALPNIRNDHLGYAITWYILAFTWACGYVVYIRRHN
ncbi:SURF1 family protein [Anaplasma bovis]|uniref:SURF1 family protein n=1 Tax=Anaplasma bovis TaxID=186733 RepID=UPI002FF24B18